MMYANEIIMLKIFIYIDIEFVMVIVPGSNGLAFDGMLRFYLLLGFCGGRGHLGARGMDSRLQSNGFPKSYM